MNAQMILRAKRDGRALSAEEIRYWIAGVSQGGIPDYQTAAWLMAVTLNGMSHEETFALTCAMRDSGDRLDLSHLPGGISLDKHSTGGVGDKTTLVVAPMLAALGVPLLKMSGRGLGFSGGTVDKLESIPGLRTELSPREAIAQVEAIGAALISQSARLAPADGILYALRDVTATVESIPLIASSIMSKKLAAGASHIVLDVKVGGGAFMKSLARARQLADELVAIGEHAGIRTSALLTEMEEPLGYTVGNALEVREAIDVLTQSGDVEPRFRDLCLELTAHSLMVTGRASNPSEARASAEHSLVSGLAARKFEAIICAQGGPASLAATREALPQSDLSVEVRARMTGAVTGIDAEAIGRLAVSMGAGRLAKTDAINPSVGITLHAKTWARVHQGDRLATLHLRRADQGRAEVYAEILESAYRIENASGIPDALPSLVLESRG